MVRPILASCRAGEGGRADSRGGLGGRPRRTRDLGGDDRLLSGGGVIEDEEERDGEQLQRGYGDAGARGAGAVVAKRHS